MQDFPYERPPLNQAIGMSQQFPAVPQYCKGCAIEHLSKDCPKKPIVAVAQIGKIGLNFVKVIPSPTTSETEQEMGNVPLRVVTRAQARRDKSQLTRTRGNRLE